MKVIFACDESGAKGRANQKEQREGQVGVFAGILLDEEHLPAIKNDLEKAIEPFRKIDAKLHITDLEVSDQEALRQAVYKVITEKQLPCFWYAIHVEGYHSHHRTMEELVDAPVAAVRSANCRIKVSNNRRKPESLHSELFIGLYGNMLAFIEERKPGKVDIEVRTDRVDKPIATEFRKKAERLLDNSPRTTTVKAFDSKNNEVVSSEIQFKAYWPKELEMRTKVTSLKVETVDDTDPIVVAADILANSLNYLFMNRRGEDVYKDLNRPSAISTHPLAKSLDTFQNWGGPDIIGDQMYRHPKAKGAP